jgi:putative flippase GtrA
MTIALKYAIFAVLATVVNIGSQDISLRVYAGDGTVLLSVLVGTAVGLVVKYQLDKKYIFNYIPQSIGHDSRTFALYTAMGLFTTALFWGVEFGFDWIFNSREMRYLGGVIGLAVGYWMKYQLDKRFVFLPQED